MCIRDSAATGQPRWGYRTGGQVLLTPAVAADKVLVPSRDGVVHALRVADGAVSYTHLRAHETVLDLVCRLLLEKKKTNIKKKTQKHTQHNK